MVDELRQEKGPVAWMAGHSVAANIVMAVLLIGGFFALANIKQELFPDLASDVVSVSVVYPGSSPEEIEEGIILSIEEAITGLSEIAEITAIASEGSGMVSAELVSAADPMKVAQDIKSEVDRIRTFPVDIEEPKVRVQTRKRSVLTLAVFGNLSTVSLNTLAEHIRDVLLQNENITQVELSGVPPLEIAVEISEENLRRYGLRLDEVAQKLSRESLDLPGGGIKTTSGEILVRVKERRSFGEEFAAMPIITTTDGGEIALGQIAHIEDSFEDNDRYATYNGKPAVMLEVYRVGDQTPVEVADAVQDALTSLPDELPPGVEIAVHDDRSESYRQRMKLMISNGIMGLLLVLILLGLFLEIRLAFWVMMGIPVSFLGAFLFLPFFDVTINMISMFAFVIALGIVVDDAIVIGENIYFYRQEGGSILNAAVKGTRDVAMPVTFSVLTNIVTFLPISFIPGHMGKIFYMIPIVVCTVFTISLVESIFILPAHLSHVSRRRPYGIFALIHDRQQRFAQAFLGLIDRVYRPFLSFLVANRYVTMTAALGLLVLVLSYAVSGRIGFQLFPKTESDLSEAIVVLPYGSPIEKTANIVNRLIEVAQGIVKKSGHPELVREILADYGESGSHTGAIKVEMAPPEIRDRIMSTEEFTNAWRSQVGEIVGVESLRFSSESGGPGGRGRPITVELSHRDMTILEKASSELAELLAGYPKVKDIDDGFQLGKEQFDIVLNGAGKSLGLSASDVARQVRSAFFGAEALRQQRGRNEIKIMVRLPESDRRSEKTLESLMIRTNDKIFVPLKEIAEISRSRAFKTIDRKNGRRVVQVSADVSPRSQAQEILGDLKINVLPNLIVRYPGLQYSFEGHQADMRESMESLKYGFVLALLAIYAMLAIPFRSYTQPFVVMFSIPFGIVGSLLGHLLMGYDLCIPSIFGIVALSGVVINDSLVMIDYTNQLLRSERIDPGQAIIDAAVQRFRPIFLTTVTTFGGLAPLIFESSRAAQFLIPMALSLGFGILFATVITLLILPCLFVIIEDVKTLVANLFGKSEDMAKVR